MGRMGAGAFQFAVVVEYGQAAFPNLPKNQSV
jgi:hypothetical protein